MKWAIALCVACACGRVGFDPLTSDEQASDASTDAPAACATWGAWSSPTLLPVVNSAGIDWSPSISDDNLFLTFSSNRTGNHELFTTSRQSIANDWEPPAQITELANMFDEEDDATLSTDLREMFYGKTMLLRSTRPDLASPWVGRTVIVPGDFDLVQGAELSSDGLRLYFCAGSPMVRLFMMERPSVLAAFGAYAPTTPDPDPGNDIGYPTLSTDELELYVSSLQSGERDLFTSRRASRADPFPQVTRVAELGAPNEDEWDPEISADGTTMYLSTSRTGSQGLDLFVATRACAD